MNLPTKSVIAANGVPFTVMLVAHDVVNFYDARYTGAGFTQHGQFIGGYYADTLLSRGRGPLHLDLGVRDWRIDIDTMDEVLAWLRTAI